VYERNSKAALKKSIIQVLGYIFSLLSDKFKDFKVDNTIFEKPFYPKNTEISEIAI
jgi:hypothetical protein